MRVAMVGVVALILGVAVGVGVGKAVWANDDAETTLCMLPLDEGRPTYGDLVAYEMDGDDCPMMIRVRVEEP